MTRLRRLSIARMAVPSLLLTASAIAGAQAPSFEVASVRVSAPGTRGSQRVTETRVDLIDISLRELLLMAFRARPYQVAMPEGLQNVRVDVSATVPAGFTRAQVPAMLQTLLRERFSLVTHVEPRSIEAYELVVADGGIKMAEVDPVNEPPAELQPDPSGKPLVGVSLETVDGPYRSWVIPGVAGQRTVTSRSRYDRIYTDRRTTIIDAARMTMPELANSLSSNIDKPVIDRTGLGGVYQFRIELPADASAIRMLLAAGITTTATGTPLTEPTGGSTFSAVESLGLKLQRTQDPIDVIVVDRLERTPTEN